MSAEIRVAGDPGAEAAELLAEAAGAGAHVVLTGGSTPRAAYERLAGMGVGWAGTTVWFTDERCVPPDDERSNFGMVRAALLEPLGDTGPTVERMEGELGPAEGSGRHEERLRAAFGDAPAFDVVLLGLGPDAHIASLFPGRPEVGERERMAVGVPVAGLEPYVPRISLTLPALCSARRIVFLVTGEQKRDAVRRTFAEPSGPGAPGSLVVEAAGDRVLALLDAAAAADL